MHRAGTRAQKRGSGRSSDRISGGTAPLRRAATPPPRSAKTRASHSQTRRKQKDLKSSVGMSVPLGQAIWGNVLHGRGPDLGTTRNEKHRGGRAHMNAHACARSCASVMVTSRKNTPCIFMYLYACVCPCGGTRKDASCARACACALASPALFIYTPSQLHFSPSVATPALHPKPAAFQPFPGHHEAAAAVADAAAAAGGGGGGGGAATHVSTPTNRLGWF